MSLILVVMACGAVVATSAAGLAQPGGRECNGTLSGPQPNIVVPEGADCRLRNAEVNGNVEVREGGGLIVEGSEISGNVRGSRAEYWGFTDDDNDVPSTIGGNVEFVGTTSNPGAGGGSMSTHNFACDATEFGGNFSVRGSSAAADVLFGAAHTGNMGEMVAAMECDKNQDAGGNIVEGNYETLGNEGEVRQRYNDVSGMWTFVNNVGGMMDPKDVIENDVGRRMTCHGNVPEPARRNNTEGEEAPVPDQCDP